MDTIQYTLNRFTAQSFRRSCDRCHLQKLKCSRSTRSPSQCQRCERAGHQCVYSQRNPRQTRKLNNGELSASSTRPSVGNTTADTAIIQEQAAIDPSPQPSLISDHSVTFTASDIDMLSRSLPRDEPSTPKEAGDAADLLADWAWENFTPTSPMGQFPGGVDLFDPTLLYSPPQRTAALPLPAENNNSTSNSNSRRPMHTPTLATNTSSQHDNLFERLSGISRTLEGYLHFLANHWDRKEIQNCKHPCSRIIDIHHPD